MIARAKVRDLEICYEIKGTGEPLVLIAGLGFGRWFWHRLSPLLESHFQLILFDNRGAGDTSKAPGPYSVSLMAEDTLGLIEHLGFEKAHVLGHSLGGFIAQELALKAPHRVNRLILASTGFGGPEMVPIPETTLNVIFNRHGTPREMALRGMQVASADGFLERHPDLAEALLAYRASNPVPPEQYSAQAQAGASMGRLTEAQVNERMSQLKMPTLILFGDQDQVVPPENAPLLVAKIANARARLIPGTGHIFPFEAPAETARLLRDFLGAVTKV